MEGNDLHTNQMSEKWRRISGLVRGANTFLFGLIPGDQGAVYRYLKVEKNFCDKDGSQYRGSYSTVLDDILKNQKIERLVYEIVIPLAINEFDDPLPSGKSSLDILKDYWDKGEPPDKDTIENTIKIKWHSHKEYKEKYNPKAKYGKTGMGNCNFLDVTVLKDKENPDDKDKEKWVVRFSEFCKLWYTEFVPVSNQGTPENLSIAENSTLVGYSKNRDNITPTKISTLDAEVTNRFFEVLETLPYDLSGENHQKMITKILVLTSLSKLPETKPIYYQLSNIIDFGQMMALATITGGNSKIIGSENG